MSLEEKMDRIIELLEQIAAGSGGGEATESDAEEEATEEEPEEEEKPKRGRGRKAKAAAEEEEAPTLDDARVVMKAFMEEKGAAPMKALLAKFKVKKLSDLDESKFGAIIKAAKAQMSEDEGSEEEDEDALG